MYIDHIIKLPIMGRIFQFGSKVRIVSPENVTELFIKHLDEVIKGY